MRFNGCFQGKTSLAKNLQMLFRGGGDGQNFRTGFQNMCSTGKKTGEGQFLVNNATIFKQLSKVMFFTQFKKLNKSKLFSLQ